MTVCGKTSPAGPGCHPYRRTGRKVAVEFEDGRKENLDEILPDLAAQPCKTHVCDLEEDHPTMHRCGPCGYNFVAQDDQVVRLG